MAKEEISFERIEEFLVGRDPEKYIVGIEASYHEDFVSLIINSPERGKVIDKHKLYPFLWMKHEVVNIIYGGDRKLIKKAMKDFGVNIKALKTEDADGNEPKRMAEGYKFMATCDGAYNKLVNFFKEGGVDIFSGDKVYPNDNESTLKYKDLFVKFSPDEQFLIQTGKRLFKGMDDYNDVHRLQFDLETEGLDAEIDAIFQIGIKDNKGFEILLETKGDTPKERRDSEKNNIITFFNLLFEIRPDIITAYNSENFDWPFFQTRCNRLGLDITDIAKTLNPKSKIRWKDAALKLGGEQEYYKQTIMWGFNILDISHSVRRAQAINSDIKKWGLKYITEYSGVAKPNRVYVRGDNIHTTWADKSDYAFNDKNGDWYKISEDNPLKEDYSIVKGDYIVQRYLLDDLWETEQIDGIFNQAAYLIAKLLPTSYMRSSTMGTAGQWKLIMAAWSYENDLAIPDLQKQRDFTGGLSRLLEVGYANNVVKLDFAALYPKTQLTWDIFPLLDISGVMKGLLTYVVDKRDEFKFLTGEDKAEAKRLQTLLDKNRHKLTPERIVKAEEMIKYHKKLASDYDKKQLPLKILANSFFGAYGAPYIFNWGDSDCAEETTCRGRQSLRLMVRHFTDKYGFRALVMDTDGANFAIPDNINDVKYICNASHWKTEKYQPGTELVGLEAVLAEFNEKYMEGRMGLDIDDVCDATINFARKNYANLIDGKVKLVGNSIKSKAMPVYIEEFINTGIKLLLDGKGYEFIELYHKYVEDISNYRIPVAKIASKSKVKMTRENYNTVYCKQKNKAGSFKARQAHMELIEANDLNVDLGDVIYYVNTGDAKSHSDIKTVRDKKTGAILMKFNCKLLPLHEVENNPDFIDDEYNIPKYLDAFNTRIKPLLVCFEPEVRDFVIRNVYKDKKTKVLKLEEKNVFTKSQCKLIAGKPYNPTDQDDYEKDLMTMEDKEIRFWDSVDKLPNFIEQEEWDKIRANYKERKKVEKFESIRREYELLENIFKQLEVVDFDRIKNKNKLPKDLNFVKLANIDNKFYFVSNEWGVILDKFESIFKYEDLAIKRNKYYQSLDTDDDNRDDKYNEFKSEQDFESISHIQSEQLAEDIELLKTHGWVKVMDGYWIESDIVNNDKYDYSKAALPIDVAVAVIKKRIKDLEV
jgi:DNA polymerase elongation subunit (family B)